MDNNKLIKRKQELENITNTLLPWWDVNFNKHNNILMNTIEETEHILDGYYLFPVREINVPEDIDDIPKFINQRFQVLYSAAANSNTAILLLIQSKKGQTTIYLGFKAVNEQNMDEHFFTSLLNGIIPGKKIKFSETDSISKLTQGHKYGGVISGVPAIKIDDDIQRINLSSVVRSLYGHDYTLSIISNPITDSQKQNTLGELIRYRDILHSISKQTLSVEQGHTTSDAYTTGDNKSTTKNIGHNTGASIIIANYSYNSSTSTSEGSSSSHTITSSDSKSQGISYEQQNGIAIELEKIAEQYIERLIKGFNAGYWDTTISFATKDKISSDIIGGAFLGELSKPSENLLPPPRLYLEELKEKQNLFIPLENKNNKIFPKAIASYLTSEELSWLGSLPTESIPGFEIKKMPSLALTDINKGEYNLGNISDNGNPIENSFISISKKDLNKHLFVCGLTGSGKTTTVKQILKKISNDNIPFLVIESAKKDYRQLLADSAFKSMRIFTIGDATISPIRFNPFYIQEGIHPLVHIDYLKAIFNASFSLYGPMPHIVEKCLHRIYLKKGWNLTTGTHPHLFDKNGSIIKDKYSGRDRYYFFPTLMDLKDEVEIYMLEKDYKGELKDNIKTAIIVRLESLMVGAKGLMFNTYDFFPLEDLLSSPTVFEMENLADDDDKAFFVGLMLVLISEFRQRDNPAINPGSKALGLQHFLVVEEAHRLLKNIDTERSNEMMGNPKGKAVELFCNVIAEMRSLGQGVAVVEQIPTKISPDVIKNTNMKIVHRLVSRDDQSVLAGSLGLSDEEARYLNRLNTGFALCHKEGMEKPIESSIIFDIESHAISDQNINKRMKDYVQNYLHPSESYELVEVLNKEGTTIVLQFLNTLSVIDADSDKLLLDNTLKAIEKRLLLKNYKYNIDKPIIISYISLELMQLLARGPYNIGYKLNSNTSEIIINALKSENIDFSSIRDMLKLYWQTNNIEDFIVRVNKSILDNNQIKNNSQSFYNSFLNCFISGFDNQLKTLYTKIINHS